MIGKMRRKVIETIRTQKGRSRGRGNTENPRKGADGRGGDAVYEGRCEWGDTTCGSDEGAGKRHAGRRLGARGRKNVSKKQ